jgi:asparagine synthase (glutamine-hydrolysing)
MPGIVGIISDRPAAECESLVEAMIACMKHEPFYVFGRHSVPDMGVYAGWVAHEGSFAAGQVFFNEERDIALVFSGECFGESDTVAILRQRGHNLEPSNGGWLIPLYEEGGDRFFEQLNGLFSGLLIDRRRRKAYLFNDRYGVERIYWHKTEEAFYFASEAKALLRVLPELRAFDEEGIGQFLAFGCTFQGKTLFRDISLLPRGSLWTFESGRCNKRKYFSPEAWETQDTLSLDAFEGHFEETFKRVLPRYFRSNSRIGISLTGGLDSRLIMACRPDMGDKPICYTFSGRKGRTLDDRLAARVAATCGLEHQILRITPDFFSNFASHTDRTVYITDGCLGPLGAHEIYLNAQARLLASVRVTGVFGGQILRGLSMFKPLALARELVSRDLHDTIQSVVARQPALNGGHPLTFTAFREIAEKRYGTRAASRSQISFRTPYLDNEIVALAYRVPEGLSSSALPTSRLVEINNTALNRIPTDMGAMGKSPMMAAALRRLFLRSLFKLDYLYSEGLPHWLSPLDPLLGAVGSRFGMVGLHKFLNYRTWFRRELAAYVKDSIKDTQLRRCWPWNIRFLESLAHEHISGHKNYVHEINAVITLATVERLLFRNLPREIEVPASYATESLNRPQVLPQR